MPRIYGQGDYEAYKNANVGGSGSGNHFKKLIANLAGPIAKMPLDQLQAFRQYVANAIKNWQKKAPRAKAGAKKQVQRNASSNEMRKDSEYGPQALFLDKQIADMEDEEEMLQHKLKLLKLKREYKIKKAGGPAKQKTVANALPAADDDMLDLGVSG